VALGGCPRCFLFSEVDALLTIGYHYFHVHCPLQQAINQDSVQDAKRGCEQDQAAMLNIAKNPAVYQGDWKRLEGTDFWRLRVGGWRAVCDVQNGELLILVLKIAPRGDVYK